MLEEGDTVDSETVMAASNHSIFAPGPLQEPMNSKIRGRFNPLSLPPWPPASLPKSTAESRIPSHESRVTNRQLRITIHQPPSTALLIGTHQLTEFAVTHRKQKTGTRSNRYTFGDMHFGLGSQNSAENLHFAAKFFRGFSLSPCFPASLLRSQRATRETGRGSLITSHHSPITIFPIQSGILS